jgi:hypothetical protein
LMKHDHATVIFRVLFRQQENWVKSLLY